MCFEILVYFHEKNTGAYALLVPEHTRIPPGGLCSGWKPSPSASSGRSAPRLYALHSLGGQAVAELHGHPRAAAEPLPAGARSCRAALHQGSISAPLSGGKMILSW